MADSGRHRGPRRLEAAAPIDDRPNRPEGTAEIARSGAVVTSLVERKVAEDQEICFVRMVPHPPFDRRLVFTDRDTDRASAFRLLRQRLIDRGDARTILCTSAVHGEGKTTVAANLALAFAESGRHRVLLLEATTRSGALGEVFGFNPPKGLRTQIMWHRANPTDPWLIVQIGPPPLYILAAERNSCPQCQAVLPEAADFCGDCGTRLARNLVPVMDGVGFASAMERFRRAFDYIIIDAPPVLTSGEVSLIQDVADAVVLATRKGQSDEHSLRRAVEQIAPAPLAAVALLDQ